MRALFIRPCGPPPSYPEFVVMMAVSMSLSPMATTIMLPALPTMGEDFAVTDDKQLQLVVLLYTVGSGLGCLLPGPLTDWQGRRPVLLVGLALYPIIALLVAKASSLKMLLGLRLLQGLVAAAVYVIPISIVRDSYEGEQMAKVMSFTFLIVLIIPMVAPAVGQALLRIMSWRGIFGVLAVVACLMAVWIALRLPETLNPSHRRSPHPAKIFAAGRQVLTERISIFYTLAITALEGAMYSYISTLPQIFSVAFQALHLAPANFALCGSTMVATYILNAFIVEKVGTRRVSHGALLGYIAFAGGHALVAVSGHESLLLFDILQACTMGCLGPAAANFNAIAMAPMERIAGSASSVQGFIFTVGGALIGILIGHQWNGKVTFLPAASFFCGVVALSFVLLAERWKLFNHPAREGPSEAEGLPPP